eukprot:SAG22_NODE_3025_length_2016_cov_1.142410_3_plen_50_part_01
MDGEIWDDKLGKWEPMLGAAKPRYHSTATPVAGGLVAAGGGVTKTALYDE